MKNRLFNVFNLVFALFCAFIFVQWPQFILQYEHQLIGHVNELKYQVDTLQRYAAKANKPLDQYIQKFADHSDADIASHGELMQNTLHRFDRLSKALQSLKQASIFTKPYVFLFYFQKEIVTSTLDSFAFGFPITLECFMYAFVGMFSGLFFMSSIKKIFAFRKVKIG